jgi:hypothetical protein
MINASYHQGPRGFRGKNIIELRVKTSKQVLRRINVDSNAKGLI